MARFPEILSLCFWGPPTTTTSSYISQLCFELEQIWGHFYVGDPHVGWEKWSRICSNLKHSRDVAAAGGGGGGPQKMSDGISGKQAILYILDNPW